MARIRYFLLLAIWGVGLAIGGSILVILMFITRRTAFAPPVIRYVIKLGFRAVGVDFVIEGLEKLDAKKTYLYVANHQSVMDVPAVYNYLPRNVGFLAKIEIRKIPVLYQGASQLGMVFVNRRNREQARVSTAKVAQRLREGMSFIVFPEGTRSETGKIGPFKKGAFHIALEVGATLVPMTITNAYQIMPKRGCRIFPGVIKTVIHDPVDATKFSTVEELKNHVAAIVASGLPPTLQS